MSQVPIESVSVKQRKKVLWPTDFVKRHLENGGGKAPANGENQKDFIFGRNFSSHRRRVVQLAYKILGNREDAEDAAQDVFISVYRKSSTFRGDSQFYTWLYRITVNAALARLRYRKRRKEVSYHDYLPKFNHEGRHRMRPLVDWSNQLEEHSYKEEIHHILEIALGDLGPLDKVVLLLSDVEELADREIAYELGLTVSAVKSRLHRARLFLRGVLAVKLEYHFPQN